MSQEVAGATEAQRRWVLDRDGHRCQRYHFDGIRWLRCNRRDHLQVHHVIARYWASVHLPPGFHVNGPYNLITLCEHCHIGSEDSAHPDTFEANQKYRAGNHNAYNEMNTKRRALTEKGIPYWNTVSDWSFNRILKRLNVSYLKRHPYPSNGVRGVTGRK